jgi:hypothetical protein
MAGVVAGSVIDGIAGKALAERLNPQHEDEYWRNEFPQAARDAYERLRLQHAR